MNPSEIIEKIMGHPVKVRLLRYLVAAHGGDNSGRMLAKVASVSPPTVIFHLRELCEQGLVFRHIIGKNHSFRLNMDNILVKSAIIPLFETETGLITSFGEILTKDLEKLSIETVIFYGSIGRGEGNPKSDWDVLILCKEKDHIEPIRKHLEEKGPMIRSMFSSTVDVKIFHTAEFVRRYFENDKFARRVYDDFLNSRVKNPILGISLTEIINTYGSKKD